MSRISVSMAELASKQKTSKGVSLYSRFINRPAGRFFAALGQLLGMTPNQMTLASALCTFSAIAVLAAAPPSWTNGVLIAALLILGFILDSADGQLARLTGASSAAGEWLDHVVDCARSVLIHSAVLVSFYRFFELTNPWMLTVPLVFQFAAVVLFVAGTLAALLKRSAGQSGSGGAPSLARSVLLLPADFGILAASFVLLGSGQLFVVVYSALAAIQLLLLAALGAKWFTELSAT
jgi:phosphatidylglycerophosphate synthase